ncbi:MAG: prepilin-type N-terminal cleavage/methylation domain-containing protein [Eubacteriales bacterium]
MKSNKGFTLVETLIAIALIMIAIFVFAPIFAQSFKQISDAGVWQNVIIKQRASIEEQLAGRSSILSDDTNYPPIDITINLYDADEFTADTAVDINGKIISDALGDKSYIRSFLTNIYQNEILSDSVPVADDGVVDIGDPEIPEIIVAPKNIYYGEDLYKDSTGGKTFTLYGINLTFTTESIGNITISGSISPNIKNYFNIVFNESANSLELTVNNTTPDNFFLEAPFKIVYNSTYTADIAVLMPQIVAVTRDGDFITGFIDNENIMFSNVIEKIPSLNGNINQIVYNFQNREYVAVGNTNQCRVFEIVDNKPAWKNKDTTSQFPDLNNNYSVSVDWLNNYMIGSAYNTTEKKGIIEVFLSVYSIDANNFYALLPVYKENVGNGNDSIQSIDAKWFDFIRSTVFVETFDSNNVLITSESNASNYIFALGYYGVGYQVSNSIVYLYYDMLYAAESYTAQEDAVWFDISSSTSGMPSNTSSSSVKITGTAGGVGRYEQGSGETITKSADFSILLACTNSGRIYGISPGNSTNSMIIENNTNWKLVKEADYNLSPLNSIVYGNDIFVAVGSGEKNMLIGTVNKNTDSTKIFDINISWQSKNIDGADFFEIEFINEKFYAVGSLGSKGVIYSSTDGLTWTKIFATAADSIITSIAGE